MLQKSLIASSSMLQLISCLHSSLFIRFILLGFSAGCRIYFLQFRNGKRCFCRILSLICLIKIYQLRLSLAKLGNDQSHLQTPVSQMHIADHFMSCKAGDSLHTLTNDRRPEMSYMQRLCHIRSAIIDHNGLRIFCFFTAHPFILLHTIQVLTQVLIVHFHIDESRIHRLDFSKHLRSLHCFHNCIGDHDRCLVVLFGCRHGTIALILAQIRSIGQTDTGIFFIITCFSKSFCNLCG